MLHATLDRAIGTFRTPRAKVRETAPLSEWTLPQAPARHLLMGIFALTILGVAVHARLSARPAATVVGVASLPGFTLQQFSKCEEGGVAFWKQDERGATLRCSARSYADPALASRAVRESFGEDASTPLLRRAGGCVTLVARRGRHVVGIRLRPGEVGLRSQDVAEARDLLRRTLGSL